MTDPDDGALIKSAIKLSEYVARHSTTPLRARGSHRYMACCILHDDSDPSMSIDDELGLWKCFSGCGGGSIIDLWMAMNSNDSYVDALHGLSEELGVRLPERGGGHAVSQKRIFAALDALTEAAHDYLINSKDEAPRAARRYLSERRIRPSVSRDWRLGILPPGRTAVEFVLAAANQDTAALVAGGVLQSTPDGRQWAHLNGRLLFPVYDSQERVVALSGRVVPEVDHSSAGKYINAVDTVVYRKSTHMYGADLITDEVAHLVVVEGYLDTIGFNHSGLPDDTAAAAVCGTSFSVGHLKALKNVKRFTLVFDGDVAGRTAVTRALWLVNHIPNGLNVVNLPAETDPWDQFVDDPSVLPQLLTAATPVIPTAAMMQWELVAKDPEQFNVWVKTTVASLTYSAHRDQLIKSAADIMGRAVSGYRRELAVPDIGARRQAKAAEQGGVVLSGHTSVLVSALLEMEPDVRHGVLAGLSTWTRHVNGAVTNWLPTSDQVDVDVLKRLALGERADSNPEVDRLLARMLEPESDQSPVDLGVVLRGTIKGLLAAISDISERGGLERYLEIHVLTLRKLIEVTKREPGRYPVVLTYLLDASLDVERAMVGLESRSMEAVSGTRVGR